jgi:phosphoglycolate phosphatase-like HAD superfamily hydrolase
MLFSGYIFDVEGTLVDSVRQNLLSLQESLANFGATVAYDLYSSIRVWMVTRPFNSLSPGLDPGERKQVLDAQGKLYQTKHLGSVKAFRRRARGVRDASKWRREDCATARDRN